MSLEELQECVCKGKDKGRISRPAESLQGTRPY